MRHIYVDESIHDRGDFIVIAVVVTHKDISIEVQSALAECGFVPGVDEFKSSMPMANNEAAQNLREAMKGLIFEKAKLALAVCAIADRASIMSIAATLINQISEEMDSTPAVVHFDEGIVFQKVTIPVDWILELECDSKIVGGIQLADCAAHVVSTLILSELGLVDKRVLTHGHYPEPEVELAWELWTEIRYSLSSGRPVGDYDDDGRCEPMMQPYGLLVSSGCNHRVIEAVHRRFGEIWIGCIH